MHLFLRALATAALLTLALSACDDTTKTAAAPTPIEPTQASIAHFCNMAVLEHPGPKGQIFLKNKIEPVWFASVRDTVAFTLLPEEPKDIVAIYVNDMGKAEDSLHPKAGGWIDARGAWYVLGSDFDAAMGGREAVPFGAEADARRFAAIHGGTVARFGEVPQEYVLGPDTEPAEPHAHPQQAAAPAAHEHAP
jgi:copper chaperone NosL